MTEEYEFPDELKLITDESMEDDGWGSESEEEKANLILHNLADFVKQNKCLLGCRVDIAKYIASLVKRKFRCPEDEEKDISKCPCDTAKIEIEKDGSTSCGVFVTKQFLKQNQFNDDLQKCQRNTRTLRKWLRLGKEGRIAIVEAIIQPSLLPISLESLIHDNEDAQLGDFIEDPHQNPEPDITARQLLKEQIEEVLNTLTPREQRVLQLRFGLEDGRSRTLEEVGKEFNVTGESIRLIQAKALRKLRHPSRDNKLKDLLE